MEISLRAAGLAMISLLLWRPAPLRASPATLFPASLAPAVTEDLYGEVLDEHNQPIAGAICTLQGGMLPEEGLSATTDERGRFAFPGIGLGTYALTCAAVGYEPVAKAGLEVTEAAFPAMQLVLPPETVLKQRVEVRAKAPSTGEQGGAPPAQLGAPQLRALPLVQQKFMAALPLIPGVVRTPDGKISIKGAVETQGLLLVDSAQMVDPVTGSFSIEIPIDAVQTLSVYKSIYLTDYGGFSGGLTTIETKAPSGRFDWELNDFVPTPRIEGGHIEGIADDEPRLYLTAPLIKNKLNFSEAFEYNYNRQPVRGLPYPDNDIKTEGFNSFTSFQYIPSERQVVSLNVDVFPVRRQYANISSLVPQTASSNYGQAGFSAAIIDRYLFASGGILTTRFQDMEFDSNAYGQGPDPMLVTPEGWGGNFFNIYGRDSNHQELSETYQFVEKDWHGKHQLKAGADADRSSYSGTSQSHPVMVQRQDGSLAESIHFTEAGRLRATETEIAAFGEDHWAPRDNLAVDYGLRFSFQTLGVPAALSPRAGAVYSPGSSGKTVLRGGVGVFYDRVPLLAGDFTENPEQVVTYFNEQGMPLGPPTVFANAYIKVNENGTEVVPSNNRLDSTPHNLTWNVEIDHEFTPSVLGHVSYLSSRTYQEFTINPLEQPGTPPTLLLTNTGASRYNEVETSLRLRPTERADIRVAYIYSQARGDLNTLSAIYIPFQAPVIVPNLFGTLPSNIPNRLVTWANFSLPREITVSPVFDLHSGFPYSAIDVLQNYVGPPDSLRFPAFASLDLKITKDFRIPFLPWVREHKLRIAGSVFNLTNHSNPRDVYNNITSPYYGNFAGFQHRFYDVYLDIVY
ncbi:MAG TPA: carboxypeptidase regulatory-like domain-containing protein [Terriglobia bacterium]